MAGLGRVAGVLFDKDGTLFDFHATWGAWTAGLVAVLAEGDGARAARLAAALGYDLTLQRFDPESPVIAGTPQEVAALLTPHLPGAGDGGGNGALVARMNALAAAAPLVPAVPLGPLLADLRGRGLRLGLATNDAEAPARSHLAAAGIAEAFDFVAGFDSGFGAKPAPGMLLAFAANQGLAPDRVVMVGDSRHDLAAGRAAGMVTVGVLTGLATAADLAPLADAILPDIGHLPALLPA
jgi:phosphoglycolate phosphatase